jgi:alpha-L-arabinofuranosidase
VRVTLGGATAAEAGRMQVLSSADLRAENSLDQPTLVAPVESPVTPIGAELRLELPPQSVTVVRVPRGR